MQTNGLWEDRLDASLAKMEEAAAAYKLKIVAEQEECARQEDLIAECNSKLSKCQKQLAQSSACAPSIIDPGKAAALAENRVVVARQRLDQALAVDESLQEQIESKQNGVMSKIHAMNVIQKGNSCIYRPEEFCECQFPL
jgi:hypothetical protein